MRRQMRKVLHIKNKLEELKKLNGFLEKTAETYHLEGAMLMQFKLALEEAVTNVILYAYPGENDQDIDIQLTYENGALVTQITDSGIAFNPIEKADPDLSLSAEERPVGGLGIFLAKQLMTEVKYNRSGDKNILIMKKEIH